jgi:hypothetical protein
MLTDVVFIVVFPDRQQVGLHRHTVVVVVVEEGEVGGRDHVDFQTGFLVYKYYFQKTSTEYCLVDQ